MDYDRNNLITHYRSTRTINIGPLREEYQRLTSIPVEEATVGSPLLSDDNSEAAFGKYNVASIGRAPSAEMIAGLIDMLKDKPYWPGRPPGVSGENPGFSDAPRPEEVISTQTYMQNMTQLINYLINK